jgi:hypothetical protein
VVVLEERTMASLAVLVAYGGGRKKKREVCMREREREQWHYYSFWWDGLEEKVRPPLFLTVLRWRG